MFGDSIKKIVACRSTYSRHILSLWDDSVLGLFFSGLAAVGSGLLAGGCFGIPKGTVRNVSVGSRKLKATGAGIVKADAQKVTFKIKCSVCGFKAEEITIDTPTAGKPYTMDWVCPKCEHKQKIVIESVPTIK